MIACVASTRRRLTLAAALALCICADVLPLEARRQDALPVFDVQALDGRLVSSRALSTEPRWIIVYATPGCMPCDRLLDVIGVASTAARMVVVVAGPPESVRAYMADRQAKAPALRIYADTQAHGSRALNVDNAPALVAIERGVIAWKLTGVLNDPSAIEPVVKKWVDY